MLLGNKMVLSGFTIENSDDNGDGVVLFGGFGPAEDKRLDTTLIGNRISSASNYGLRIVRGVGMSGYAANRNQV